MADPTRATKSWSDPGQNFLTQSQDGLDQINKLGGKVSKFTLGLKFMRKRLKKKQFLYVVTSQFFGLMYLGLVPTLEHLVLENTASFTTDFLGR